MSILDEGGSWSSATPSSCVVSMGRRPERALEWAVDEAVVRDCTLRVVTAWTWDRVEYLGVATSESGAEGHAAEI